MSSKIEVQRICQYCRKEFTARTTVTRFCSHKCSSAAHKQKIKTGNVDLHKRENTKTINHSFDELKTKEFLTVREVSRLLNCSIRSTYYNIESGTIKAVNLGQRVTRVKRSEIDKLFEKPQPVTYQLEQKQFDISDCYNLTEVQSKYGISEKALHEIIKRNNIPKIKKGWFAYVPKSVIDNLFSTTLKHQRQ